MIPIQHTCGKADACVDDYIETGAAAWSSVQPSNDIVGILLKHKGKFTIIGGYDTQGLPGMSTATPQEQATEIMRVLTKYSHLDGFIGQYMGFGATSPGFAPDAPPLSNEELTAMMANMMKPILDLVRDYETTKWRK